MEDTYDYISSLNNTAKTWFHDILLYVSISPVRVNFVQTNSAFINIHVYNKFKKEILFIFDFGSYLITNMGQKCIQYSDKNELISRIAAMWNVLITLAYTTCCWDLFYCVPVSHNITSIRLISHKSKKSNVSRFEMKLSTQQQVHVATSDDLQTHYMVKLAVILVICKV